MTLPGVALLLALLGQVKPDQVIIQEVRVENARWWPQSQLVVPLSRLQGRPLDLLQLRETLKRLGKLHEYRTLRAFLKGDTLLLRVEENPRVGRLEIQGASRIKPRYLQDTLKIQAGDPISARKRFLWERILREYYHGKGYAAAEIRIDVGRPDSLTGEAPVTVKIREGDRIRIRRIEVVGNKSFPDPVLEKLLRNREKTWYRRGWFRPEYWEEDLAKIEDFYREKGFPEARVDSTHLVFRDSWLYATIYLTEGPRFRFHEIAFEGNKQFPERVLRSKLKFRPTDPYNPRKIEESIAELSGLYADSGYLYVSIQPKETLEEDTLVSVTFRIREGHRVKVRLIEITGNTKTWDPVIRRELDIFPGEYFSRVKLIKSQRDLYFLNYFQNVEVDFKPTQDSTLIDLVFRVEEKETGTLGLGASYSQLEKAFLYLQYQQPNFLGRGQRTMALVEYGGRRRNFQLGFTEPWLGGKPYSLGFNVYHLERNIFAGASSLYEERRTGGDVTFSRPLWNDYWRVTLSYKLEDVAVSNIAENLLENPYFREWAEKGPQLTSRLSFSIRRDSRDRAFNASHGSIGSYYVELAGGPLAGEVHYHKHIAEGVYYLPIFEKFVVVFLAKGGVIEGLQKPSDVPFYERFFLGDIGPFGLRGYEARSVGPVDSRGNVVGGRFFSILTLEPRVRISETMYLLAFFDAGNAWDRWEHVNWRTLKKGAGVGIRMEIPMLGVVGFDIGYGFDNRGGRWVPHIQFGALF